MTEYEKLVKHRLIDMDMSQRELIAEVTARTGQYFDRSYLSKIYRGTCHSKRFIGVINEIVGIEASV